MGEKFYKNRFYIKKKTPLTGQPGKWSFVSTNSYAYQAGVGSDIPPPIRPSPVSVSGFFLSTGSGFIF